MSETGLNDTARAFAERFVLNASPPAGSAISLVRLGQCRLAYGKARLKSLGAIARLKSTIRRAYRSNPGLADEVERGLGRLDALIARLNRDLENELDAVLNADAAGRAALAAKAGRTAGALATLLETDPVARSLDGNAFEPGMTAAGDLKSALRGIEAALG